MIELLALGELGPHFSVILQHRDLTILVVTVLLSYQAILELLSAGVNGDLGDLGDLVVP